jgi:hypothetical protein
MTETTRIKNRVRNRQWNRDNKERVNKNRRDKYSQNKEIRIKNQERVRKWCQDNREKANQNSRNWYNRNKERAKEIGKKSRNKNLEENRKRAREYARQWRAANPELARERGRESMRKWYNANPEEARKKNNRYNLKYRRESKEKVRVKNKKWRVANKDKVNTFTRTRRARKHGASGFCSAEQAAARIAYYGGACAYCGGPYEQLDHVIAIACGGSSWPANLRPSCRYCNQSKSDKPLAEWLRSRR